MAQPSLVGGLKMMLRRLLFGCAVSLLVSCGVSQSETVLSDSSAASDQDLQGGCHTVCPKCRPNTVCPMWACYLKCPSKSKGTCGVRAMCIIGYEWSEARCSCVPIPGNAKQCQSDADCRTFSSYCNS